MKKKCTKCEKSKPVDLDNFPPDKRMNSGFSSWCRVCVRTQVREIWKRKVAKKKLAV